MCHYRRWRPGAGGDQSARISALAAFRAGGRLAIQSFAGRSKRLSRQLATGRDLRNQPLRQASAALPASYALFEPAIAPTILTPCGWSKPVRQLVPVCGWRNADTILAAELCDPDLLTAEMPATALFVMGLMRSGLSRACPSPSSPRIPGYRQDGHRLSARVYAVFWRRDGRRRRAALAGEDNLRSLVQIRAWIMHCECRHRHAHLRYQPHGGRTHSPRHGH